MGPPVAYPEFHTWPTATGDASRARDSSLVSARGPSPAPGRAPLSRSKASSGEAGGRRVHNHGMADERTHEGPGHGVHSHSHAISADADSRKLALALGLIVVFMAGEVVAGIVAQSLALLSDAAHMLTDAIAIALALVALRLAERPASGSFTYGLRRAEILSAAVNGVTLLLLGAFIVFEGVRRLIDPPEVEGALVLIVALIGIPVNLMALRLIASAERRSLNVEGAYQHILTDLFAFVATAVAGALILTVGFERADGIASLMVAATMLWASYGLLRDSGRVFMEAAPRGPRPRGDRTGARVGGRRRRGPRPARLGGDDGHGGGVGPHDGRPRRRPGADPLPRRVPARGALRGRALDAPGRAGARRQRAAADRDVPEA